MITAKIIADSISTNGVRITTMELNYPRFIHSEFMTHRMFSRNASSSRAIPVEKMLQQVRENPAMPIHWGKNQPGMQAEEECNSRVQLDWDYYNDCEVIGTREDAWKEAAQQACSTSHRLNFAGYHKQIVNRLTEPFQHIKVIVTATEYDNFFKLRCHEDAQPEMYELARCMKEAMENSIPKELGKSEWIVNNWHLPYVNVDKEELGLEPDIAVKCSVARCARVSYLNHDNSSPSIEKDIDLYSKLLEAGHMSPFEHQATPMDFAKDTYELAWEKGVTHKDRKDNFWSGNFRGFLQYRQLL